MNCALRSCVDSSHPLVYDGTDGSALSRNHLPTRIRECDAFGNLFLRVYRNKKRDMLLTEYLDWWERHHMEMKSGYVRMLNTPVDHVT